MTARMSTYFLGVAWLAIASLALSKEGQKPSAYQLKPVMDGAAIGLHMEILSDKNHSFTFEQIRSLYEEGRFVKSTEKIPNFGMNPATQWVRFELHNSGESKQEVLIEHAISLTDSFTLYHQMPDGTWYEKSDGDQYDISKRDIKNRLPVFQYFLQPGTHVFFGKSSSIGTKQIPLHIWTPDEFYNRNALEYAYIGILVGFHVVVCLYNLFLYTSLRDRTYLFYVLYVASNLLYQVNYVGLFQQVGALLGGPSTASNVLLILSVDLVAITSLLFSERFLNLPKRLPSFVKVFKAAQVLSLINMSITSFVSLYWGNIMVFVTASIATILLISSGFLVARQGYLPAKFYLAAWACYLIGVTGTLSNLLAIYPTDNFARWGQFTGGAFEVAILSLALGARINFRRKQNMLKIKELNTGLEEKVKERTSEIQSLLQHIPQGILSMGREGIVDSNYSAKLPEILGHKEIAGRPFKDLILDHTGLSLDERDQAWQSILASMDEDELNFHVNRDKLPEQILYHREGFRKFLRLTWNVETTANGDVRHILVTMLDVSNEVAAQQELERKNQEFEIIRQLVELGAKKSIQFFASGRLLLEEISRLIESGDHSEDTLKILFVNAHTLKGAARSLRLKELANEFHNIEAYYAKILKEKETPDQDRLRIEFKQALSCYTRYENANIEVLDRKPDHTKVPVDREFLQENVKLLSQLVDLDSLSYDLKDIIHRNRDELTQAIFMSLPSIITDIMSQAEKIARDLGKDAPKIHTEIEDALLTYDQEMALKNSFVHLLRNALDHGIEAPSIRTAKRKPSYGNIHIHARVDHDTIRIQFWDDGRGLAIDKLRQKASHKGLISEGAKIDDIANTVFETGFSTAETLSIVSGRGVGMGAVLQFMEGIKGSVEIHVEDPIDEEQTYYRFKTYLTLPAMASVSSNEMTRPKAVS
ncbi:7TM diverse intracellular signaling domain-containing protein [Pseudobacteriovorax antillogorgiicola]|uniref:Hpt domain-containing protein n=1 Tax=Pseudobacteriovorax antillogorgiicola TaxID=1513793 RepID=A0A1Y6BF73_9BACT|nr:7TM diverse intracellular signaling domain-containing protein [Pseudobacteriovorax antillogorgiicola]TCS57410.1 Hpt domain-containing protein [Pseudobacteriovorax antillogorgiicola]SMF01476.1 Hpt domain-containing protein [Pseudobacteriovorax antillogorgiicola]